MRTRNLLCSLTILLATIVVSRAADYTDLEAAKHIGEEATVTGRIEDVHEAKGGSVFVNMGGRHPKETFTAFIPAKSAKDFPDIKDCNGLTLSISGKIQDHQGKPEIVVTSAAQISRKDGATKKTSPPVAATVPIEAKPTVVPSIAAIQTGTTAAATPTTTSRETVTLTQPVQVRLRYGAATLPAGMVLQIVSSDANGIVVDYAGERVTLPPR